MTGPGRGNYGTWPPDAKGNAVITPFGMILAGWGVALAGVIWLYARRQS
jgi:hypothetical protein